MKKNTNIIFRIRKRDKDDFVKMTKEYGIPMSEYLYDLIKEKLKKWKEKK